MAARTPSPLSAQQLERIQSGLKYCQWAFTIPLILALFGLLTGGFSSYQYGGAFSLVGFLAPLLGFFGVGKLRKVVAEMIQGAPAQAAAPARVPPAVASVASAAPTPKQSGFGSAALLQMEEDRTLRAAAKKREPSGPRVDWEQWIGKRLLQTVGILIVLIGMIVLLKYSFDNRIIGELGRIALGAFAAIVLVGVGEWFHRKYPSWAQVFTGGGLALLYFTVWVAHVFYRQELLAQHGLEIPFTVAMILYGLITVVGALAAVRYRSQSIAWFTALGGYLTPFLIETPNVDATFLTIYLAILTAGLLTLSWHQKWSYLTLASFFITQLYLFGIVYDASMVSDTQQVVFAIGFFVLFAFPPLLSQFRLRRKAETDDISLILLDGAAAFLAVVDGLGGFGGDEVGLVSLILAAVYMTFAAAALSRRADDDTLVNTYLLSSIGLIALALFAQMETEWVAAGWAPFSALLFLIATRMKRRSVLGCAVTLLGGALLFLFFNLPMVQASSEALWHPFTSHWALLSYVVFASLLAWLAIARNVPSALLPTEEKDRLLPSMHTIIALILFAGITFEVTQLHWVASLPLSFAYLAFSVCAIGIYVVTGVTIWFLAAFLVQILVLLFTFVFGNSSGMVSPILEGHTVVPFLHPWGAVSAVTLISLLALLAAALRRPHPSINPVQFRALIIGIVSAQVWVHVSVEIQHLQLAYLWSETLFERVLSGWWIVFTVPFFVWGLRKNSPTIQKIAVALLVLPFLKDLSLIAGGDNLYEVALWTAVPFVLLGIGTQLRSRIPLVAGSTLLALTVAADMLPALSSDRGLLRTVWWAVVGLLTICLGFLKNEALLRRLAIGIFAATVVKLLVFDFAFLSTGVRIVASILTGLLLIGASYLYQRFDSQLSRPSPR